MEKLKLEIQEAKTDAAKKENKAPQKIYMVNDQEWVALIVNLLRKFAEPDNNQPETSPMVTITNIACLGKFTDPKTMHKAYTSPVALNPLFCSKKAAQACDKESRLWISNIQAIGDDVNRVAALDRDLAELARRHDRGTGATVMDWEYLLAIARKRP